MTAWSRWWRRAMRRGPADRESDPQVSPACVIEHGERLVLGRAAVVGPFTYIDASGGVRLGEGVRVASHVAIVTHAQHRSQRLLGPGYGGWPATPESPRPGWIAGPVDVGAFTFIGPHSLIEANTRLGRGTLVCAGSFVRGEYPDFSILEGRPARVVGDTRVADRKLLLLFPELQVLYDAWAAAPQDHADLRFMSAER
jgi:acetyltransferase-like isoleucine patch superfamily enzyme